MKLERIGHELYKTHGETRERHKRLHVERLHVERFHVEGFHKELFHLPTACGQSAKRSICSAQ